MRFEELNWMDVEAYLQQEDRLMLITGATEQHGYLSLLTDIKIPLAMADAASQKTGVLVAPPLNFGCSPYFLAYPGTLSLRASTLMDVLEDLIRSAHQTGFRRMLVINGHGSNLPARVRLREVANALPSLQLQWYDWWESHAVEAVAQKHNLKPEHANWLEAFAFTQVCELPQEPKIPPYVPAITNAAQTRQLYGDGSFGGPYQADPAIMQDLFNAALEDILQLLQFEGFPPPSSSGDTP
jgi:creatinine amidohydrolase